jgi:hypothetical protein
MKIHLKWMKNIDASDSIRTPVNEDYQTMLDQIELIKPRCKNRLDRGEELVKMLAKSEAPEKRLLLEKCLLSILSEEDPRLDHLLDESEGEQDISNREDPQEALDVPPHNFFEDAMHYHGQ